MILIIDVCVERAFVLEDRYASGPICLDRQMMLLMPQPFSMR
jgi:hypothetical protein